MQGFRGKKIYNGEWVYGWLVPFNEESYTTGERMCIRTGILKTFEVYPATVGQYSGVHDIKDKEIYKGDIAKFNWNGKERVGEILTVSGGFSLGLYMLLYDSQLDEHKETRNTIDIIGNIWDNPELLCGKQHD